MGFFDSLIGGAISGYYEGKNQARQQAYAHLQQMKDKLDMIERVCEHSSCYNCKYGTSPSACEMTALGEMYNEALEFYASKGLVKMR